MDSEKRTITLRFEGVPPREGNRLASELSELVASSLQGVQARIAKDDATTMDMGSTVVLVLGTPAAIALARGLADYLKKRRCKVSITPEGGVEATGLDADAAARVVEAVFRRAKG